MATFAEKLKAIETADESGDQLASLKAQKSMLISLMSRDDLDIRDLTQLSLNVTRLSIEVVRLEGLRREFSEEQDKEIDAVGFFNRAFGKEGKGLG